MSWTSERKPGFFRRIGWFLGGLWAGLSRTVLEQLGHVRVYASPLWFVLNPKPFKVTARHIRAALSRLEPGDVIVRAYDTYLLSLFIPGRFSHSAVYVGAEDGDLLGAGLVVHALGTGVQRCDVVDFLMACDAFAILRPQCDYTAKGDACRIAFGYVGTPYDYTFSVAGDYRNKDEVEKRTRALYCHELTRSCFPYLDIPLVRPVLWNGMIRSSKKQFLADSFFRSPDFKVVYDSFYSDVHV